MINKIKKYKLDILIVGIIIFISLITSLIISLTKEQGNLVVVKIKNEEIASYQLNIDGKYSLNNGTNILVIEDNYAWIVEADCPDKLCIKKGKISNVGESIICLPHRLIITIEGEINE